MSLVGYSQEWGLEIVMTASPIPHTSHLSLWLGWGGAGRGGGRPLLVPCGTADGSGDVIVCTGEFTSAFLTSIQRDAFGN